MTTKEVVVITSIYLTEANNPENQNWCIIVENTTVSYNFVGENIEEQNQSVERLSEMLEENGNDLGDVYANIGLSIEIPEDMKAETVTEQLFSDSTEIAYRGAVLYLANVPEDTLLIDCLVEVGSALSAIFL